MRKVTLLLLILISYAAKAQKIDSIYFNLYTDSLKKGVHNYINIDGKFSTGKFLPLMADEVMFASTFGKWDGNSLIFDLGSTVDSVIITATLKNRPEVKKSVTIHLKKIEVEPALKTEEELLNEWNKKGKRKN